MASTGQEIARAFAGLLRGGAVGIQLAQRRRHEQQRLETEQERLKLLQQAQKGKEAQFQLKMEKDRLEIDDLRQKSGIQQQFQQLLQGVRLGQLGGASQSGITPPPNPSRQAMPIPQGQGSRVLPEMGIVSQKLPSVGDLESQMDQLDRRISLFTPFIGQGVGGAKDFVQAMTSRRNSLQQTWRTLQDEERKTNTRLRKLPVDMRNDLRQEISFKLVENGNQALSIVRAGFKQQNNMGDGTMITGFARMQDPGGIVRPSEAAEIRARIPMMGRAEMIVARVMRGEELRPEDRQIIMNVALQIQQEYINNFRAQTLPIYLERARNRGVDIRKVFTPYRDVIKEQRPVTIETIEVP